MVYIRAQGNHEEEYGNFISYAKRAKINLIKYPPIRT